MSNKSNVNVKKYFVNASVALCLLSCSTAYADVQQPYDVGAPKIKVGNTNGFYPNKDYFEYYYDVASKSIKNGAERNPIPWVGTNQKVYQTDKWYTDLSFAAIDRPSINLFDDFRTAASPLNVRVIDSVLHAQPGDPNSHIIGFPGLWVTAPKKPYMSLTAQPSPQKIQTDFHAYVFQGDTGLDLAFAIPDDIAKNKENHISREILGDKTDDLTFTTRWRVSKAGQADASMTAPIVRGSPYMTMLYDNLPVAFNAMNVLSISVDGGRAHFLMDEVGKTSYTGQRFRLVVASSHDNYGCNKHGPSHDNGGNATCEPLYSVYTLYTSKPITLSFKATTPSQPIEILQDAKPFTGVARLAYAGSLVKSINDSPKDISLKMLDGGDFSQQLALLDKYSNVYPTGAKIDLEKNGTQGNVKFHFNTASFDNGSGNSQLLMTAFEATQLANMNAGSSDASAYVVDTVRGPMRGIVGQDWTQTIKTPLSTKPDALWYGNQPLNPAYKKVLTETLQKDLALMEDDPQLAGNTLNAANAANDSYAFGKKIARLARLALIADELQDKATALKIVQKYMAPYLNYWLTPPANNTDIHGIRRGYFKYDDKFGGVITARSSVRPEECAAEPDGLVQCGANLDFYNGMYTDHHFHYGYFLYAAAVMAKIDPEWKQTYQPYVDLLARDIANPSNQDPYFPTYRHFDWFEGHGYANGVGPNASGRDQESSSEAVNAWYGLALWGEVTGRSNMQSVGEILTAMEIQAAKTWTQIIPGQSVYDDYSISAEDRLHNPFGANVKMSDSGTTGINWAVKVDHSTFFGNKLGFVMGIEMLPYTPITTELFSKQWVDANKPGALKQALSALNQQLYVYGDIKQAMNVYSQDTASPNWLGFQGVPNTGYQWGMIVSPIQSLDGNSGPLLFDAMFNSGYAQAMQTVNDNLVFSGLLGTDNLVKLDCPAGVFFKANACTYKLSNVSATFAIPFTYADYRGLDNGMSYTNMIWWLAKTDQTSHADLNWKKVVLTDLATQVNKDTLTANWKAVESDPNASITQFVVNLLKYNAATKTYSLAKTVTLSGKETTAAFTGVEKGQYGVIVVAKDSHGIEATAFSSMQTTVGEGGGSDPNPPIPPSGDAHTFQVAMGITKDGKVTPAGGSAVNVSNGSSFTAKGAFNISGAFGAIQMNCDITMNGNDPKNWTHTTKGAPNSCDGPNTVLDGSGKYFLYLP